MKIRKATIKDFNVLLKLKLESKEEERRFSEELIPIKKAKQHYKEYLRNDLKSEWRVIFIAEENNKMVGLIVGKIYRTLRVAGYIRCGYISNLYVKKGFRKRGIAQKLIKELVGWFKRKKAKKVTLDLYEKNIKAINLYQKLKFKKYFVKMTKRI